MLFWIDRWKKSEEQVRYCLDRDAALCLATIFGQRTLHWDMDRSCLSGMVHPGRWKSTNLGPTTETSVTSLSVWDQQVSFLSAFEQHPFWKWSSFGISDKFTCATRSFLPCCKAVETNPMYLFGAAKK